MLDSFVSGARYAGCAAVASAGVGFFHKCLQRPRNSAARVMLFRGSCVEVGDLVAPDAFLAAWRAGADDDPWTVVFFAGRDRGSGVVGVEHGDDLRVGLLAEPRYVGWRARRKLQHCARHPPHRHCVLLQEILAIACRQKKDHKKLQIPAFLSFSLDFPLCQDAG
jgi:hypothetical protein